MASRYASIPIRPVITANPGQVVGYLGPGLIVTTISVNSLVYQSQSTKQAAAAGFILLSMVIVSVWVSE